MSELVFDRVAMQKALDDAFWAMAENVIALARIPEATDAARLEYDRVQFFGTFLDNIRNDDSWWSDMTNVQQLVERMDAEKALVVALLNEYSQPGLWSGFPEALAKRFVEMWNTAGNVGGQLLDLGRQGLNVADKAASNLPWIALIVVTVALLYVRPTASGIASGVRTIRKAAKGA